MPVVTLTLMQGYDSDTRQRLTAALSRGVRSVIAAPDDGTTVVIYETAPENYRRGPQPRIPGTPMPAAGDAVRDYLAAMEARELERARSWLAPDFEMIFPGGARFTSLEELIAWAKPRYQWVKKRMERLDEAPADDGVAVTCFGTLYGAWPDGSAFEGIRYMDWILVERGRLRRQLVWNDMGETMLRRQEGRGT